MDKASIVALIKQTVAGLQSAARFQISPNNRHIHNNVDAPFVYLPYQIYAGLIPYDGNVSDILPAFLPKGWTITHPTIAITFTAPLSIGDTSATLTTAWTDSVALGYVLYIYFSNGEVYIGSFTENSTSVTWAGALLASATVNAVADATGQYNLKHNLGTGLYSCIPTATDSLGNIVAPVVSQFKNETTITWFQTLDLFTRANTSFSFTLTVFTGNNGTFPTFVANTALQNMP